MARKSTDRKTNKPGSSRRSNGSRALSCVGGVELALVASDSDELQAEDLPSHIQWMPPGKHDIQPRNSATGRGVKLSVNVGPDLVDRLNAQAEDIRKKGHDPFIDFNHNENNGAAGHIESFFWAGTDPVSGGIRANIKWTTKGAQALTGREFTRFSPCFAADRGGSVTGLSTANVGGLTNRPAFAENERIVQAEEGKLNMDPDEIKQIVASALTDTLPALVATEVKKAITEHKASEGSPPPKASDSKEAEDDEEKKELKEKLEAFEAAEAKRTKERVDKIVAAATERGIVPPKDDKAIEAFRASVEASPGLAERFLATDQETVPAYAATVTPDDQPNRGGQPLKASADMIEQKIMAYASEHNVDTETAYQACRQENPTLFA